MTVVKAPGIYIYLYIRGHEIPTLRRLDTRPLRSFPAEARRETGFQLDAVQRGLMPDDFKPMPAVGAGAYEIRIHVEGEWRVLYVAKFEDAVYVLHAFQKKTQ